MSELPAGWAETTIGQVFSVVGGGTPDRGNAAYWAGNIPWISSADISQVGEISIRRRITPEAIEGSATFRAPADSVIVVTRVGLGKVARAREPVAFSQDCQALLPVPGIDAEFLRLQMTKTAKSFIHQSRGTTIGGVTKKQLLDLPLLIPPTGEQRRIVEAIEDQFSRLDAGAAMLNRISRNLIRMQTAVQRDMWNWALEDAHELSQVVDLLDSPLANGRSVTDGPADGFPVLRLTCVRNGFIDDTETKPGSWTPEQANQYLVRKGDFLVVRGNGSKHLVGRGGLVSRSAAVAYPDTLIRIRPNVGRITPAFLRLMWDTPSVRRQIEQAARTTAGIYKINQVSLGQIELPVPRLDAQQRIVDWSTRQLSQIGLLNIEIGRALGRANNLRSSVLFAACSGNLVAQDPREEPASILLEHIAAERDSSNGYRSSRVGKARREVTV